MNMNMDSELQRKYIPKIKNILENDLGFEVMETYGRVNLGVNYIPDQLMSVKIGKFNVPVMIEVKGQVSHLAEIKKFAEIASNFNGITILVAHSIDEKIKEKLRQYRIGFLEIDKEINIPFEFLLSRKKKVSQNELIKKKGFRAESNIKLLLYFITLPESLGFTQRELAMKLGVSLGAINGALKNLETVKMIIPMGKRRLLGRFDDIADRWRISFQDFEAKNHFIGRYSPASKDFFLARESGLSGLDAYWGGEVAAALRTGYLSPEYYSIYTYDERVTKLLNHLRLKKDPNGQVGISRCFWPKELNNSDKTVPDFVTYCELLNSGIDRNIETAKILRERIREKLGKYEY